VEASIIHNLTTKEWEEVLGAQVRAARLSADLDQQSLADLADLSVDAVRNFELGRGATLRTVVRVARALDRTDWLQAFAPSPTVSPLDVVDRGEISPRQRVARPRRRAGN
jgi:transcriptional regulator with XRE-family HTH domain